MSRGIGATCLASMVALAAAASSCGAEDGGCVYDGAMCIAFQRDFAPYSSWERVDIGETPLAGHPSGNRYLRVNRRPPAGSTEWPVGTIIVKVIEPGATHPATDLFAMVKRGGGYNAAGARGWEFFTLGLSSAGVPVITARGLDPSTGDLYVDPDEPAQPAPSCNGCHGAPAARRDHVLTPSLELPGFSR